MGEAEEALAAELSMSSIRAWGKLQGVVTSQLKVPFDREGEIEELPITVLQNLRTDADEAVRRRAHKAEVAAWESVRESLAAGNVVVVAHGTRYLTIYAHLHEISVRRGATVRRGEQVGTVGNTGWSTSPHLHYEVRMRNESNDEPAPVDPRIYILNYQWTGHEELLIQGRKAPIPDFDPLPTRRRGK